PDRDHELADLELVRVADADGVEAVGACTSNGEIAEGVRADDVDIVLGAVDEGGAGGAARGDDVGGGDQESVGGDESARPGAAEAAAASTPDAQAGDRRKDSLRDGADDRRIDVERLLLRDRFRHRAYKITN